MSFGIVTTSTFGSSNTLATMTGDVSSDGFAQDEVALGHDPKDMSGRIDDWDATDAFRLQECAMSRQPSQVRR